MKKVLAILIMILTFILIYFLQSNFFTWFNISGIKPNLFIIFILIIGLYMGKNYGISLGVIFGLLLDLFIGKKFGMYAIELGIVGAIGGFISNKFSKDSKITIMLINAGTTFICELFVYIYQIIIYKSNFELLAFIKIIFIEIIFNLILTILLYPLIQKVGLLLEKTFSESKILTKYY